MKRELVALSVVMKAIGKGEEVVDADARRRLEDSGENFLAIYEWQGCFVA